LDRLNNILKQRLVARQAGKSEHPSADTLAAFAEQSLKAPQRESVLEHLAACADCRQTVMLATSEVDVEQANSPLSRKPIFQFPAAIRWASLAAAVAVAVGVGLLFNEHQSAPRQATLQETVRSIPTPSAQPAQEAAKPKSETKNSEAKNNDDVTPPAASKSAYFNEEKKKPSLTTSRDRANLSAAIAASTETPGPTPVEDAGRLSVYRKLNQQKANPAVPNWDSNQKLAATPAKVPGPAPAAPLPPPAAANTFIGGALDTSVNGASAKAQQAPTSANQTVEVTAEAPVTAQAEMVQSPVKVSPAAAVGGPLRREQSGTFHGTIANWAISDTGQLQRTLSDGTTSDVQPAPGMTIKAVASEGIEVWAAGTQSDLSAKEWAQRSVLFHSSDAGKTWSKVDGPWQSPITQLSLSGKGNLVVTTQNGIWATKDAGKTWAQINVKTKG